MAASRPDLARGSRAAAILLLAALGSALPTGGAAQVEAEPVLTGRALVGDAPMREGMVVLHRVGASMQGQLDTARVGPDGGFSFRLPTVPDPARNETYFASVRHQGILYIGTPITLAVQLDSLYTLQAYDTLFVSDPAGYPLTVQVRNLFLEPDEGRWLATDLLQVRNDAPRTLVTSEEGVVWRYPIPEGATEPRLGDGEVIPAGTEFRDGDLLIRAALPPGERLFVVRYVLDDPFVEVPMPGVTETMEFLVREPAPPLEVPGLTVMEPVELEPTSAYRRFSGSDIRDWVLRAVEGDPVRPPPVRWVAVVLAFLLTGIGLWAVSGKRSAPAPAGAPPAGADPERRALVLEIARLDREMEGRADASAEERAAYARRRRALLDRLRSTE